MTETELLDQLKRPPACVWQGIYPSSTRGESEIITATVNGKQLRIGQLYSTGVFLKICSSEHVLRKPPALAIDANFMDERVGKVQVIAVCVKDLGEWYTVGATDFYNHALTLDRGFGRQYALPLDKWNLWRR